MYKLFLILEPQRSLFQDSSRQANGPDGSSRSQSTDSGNRPRFHLGVKNNMGNNIHNKRPMAAKQQRVPNADEFPVLTGSTTPPTRSPNGVLTNGIGHHGPTAAQVLQAPPPVRKDNITEPSSRRGTPDPPVSCICECRVVLLKFCRR